MDSEFDFARRLEPLAYEARLRSAAQWPRSLLWCFGLSPLAFLGVDLGASLWTLMRYGDAAFWQVQVPSGVANFLHGAMLATALFALVAPLLIWLTAFLRREHGARRGMTAREERHRAYLAWLLTGACTLLLTFGRPVLVVLALIFGPEIR